MLSFGPLLSFPAILLAGFMLTRPRVRNSAFGLVTGIGSLLLVIAWIQRDGPLNPIPWLVAGLVLLFAGLAAHATLRD
jgi:predicted metal-binding membrane protein